MKAFLKNIVLRAIQHVESIEHNGIQFLAEDDYSDKIVGSIKLDGLEILTDSGFQTITDVHITKPYTVYSIETVTGRRLQGADNHILFDENLEEVFMKDLTTGSIVFTESGLEEICSTEKSRFKVQMFDTTVDHADHRFYTNGFLSHNTVTASIFNAWYMLFNYDKTTLLLANKSETTKEIIDKAKVVMENLPFFMKPGILKYDVMSMRADNGCRIIGQSTTVKAGIGFTIHNLYLDEFAHVSPSVVDSFYENVYPTLSSSKVSRINITSTQNGFNKFYHIYSSAVRGDNEYVPTRIDWWQHPDRDDKWYNRELANLGSEEAFNRQYGNEFSVASALLLSPISIKKIRKAATEYIWHDIDVFTNIHIDTQGFLSFDRDFDIEDAGNKKRYWLFSVDIAEGSGGDYSVINVFEIIPMSDDDIIRVNDPGAMYDFFQIKQVALFRSNEHTIEDFAKILYTLSIDIFHGENVKMIVEFNTYGNIMFKYLETIFPGRNDFEDEMILRFKHRYDSKIMKSGLKLNSANKSVFCQSFKKLIENNRITINEQETISEASMFGTVHNGRYGAMQGHDDIVMSCVNSTEFFNTTSYADYIEEMLDIIPSEKLAIMEKTLYNTGEDSGDLQYDIYSLI